jgi:L-lactate dehydrogenase complex protein LldG
MNARDEILSALRAQAVAPEPLPGLDGSWIRYANQAEQFSLAVTQAAGRVVAAAEGVDRIRATRELRLGTGITVGEARSVCSFVPSVPGNREAPREPHAYADVDVLIVEGSFGVAENGAIWLSDQATPVRAAAFLTEHLVVLLQSDALVDTLHEAYARLGAELGRHGCFVSGPSKTADIEQALVVGAHGPRSLSVLLY